MGGVGRESTGRRPLAGKDHFFLGAFQLNVGGLNLFMQSAVLESFVKLVLNQAAPLFLTLRESVWLTTQAQKISGGSDTS